MYDSPRQLAALGIVLVLQILDCGSNLVERLGLLVEVTILKCG
jgi:hypothetical protein